jgi:hypothetical protein
VSPAQGTLFGEAPPSRSRRHDPRTAKVAAAQDPDGRKTQATRILRWLHHEGTITADQALRHLTEPGEDVSRGEWSTRIGVLIHRGLVERHGFHDEPDRRGRLRAVLQYQLTPAGVVETTRMFGGLG